MGIPLIKTIKVKTRLCQEQVYYLIKFEQHEENNLEFFT